MFLYQTAGLRLFIYIERKNTGTQWGIGFTLRFFGIGPSPPIASFFSLSSFSEVGGWVWCGWGWDSTHAPVICPGMHRFIHVCVYPFKGDMRLLSFAIVGISTFIKVYVTIPKMRIYGNVGGYLFY